MFIRQQSELVAFVGRAMRSPILAIDTEFLREKTYWPRLCLMQMRTADETAIVDPFSVDDISALVPLMENEQIVKVFHAGSQDIEIIHHEMGVVPRPIFDTQVAAALLGHTQQIGYAALVSAECGVHLKKLDSFTDWSRRPLSKSQVCYAADDVEYLPRVYESLVAKLQGLGRSDWLAADFAAMGDPARYAPNPNERYLHLKRVNQLNRRQMSAARELAAWRERRAIRADIPRKWVLTDEQVVEACKREARTIDDLLMVRGMAEKLSTAEAREVVAAIAKGLDRPQEEWPHDGRPQRSEANVDIQLDLMNALVRLRARENDIAFQTLASHDDLVRLARGHAEESALMQGWRRKIVGDELERLLHGELTLRLDGASLLVERREGASR